MKTVFFFEIRFDKNIKLKKQKLHTNTVGLCCRPNQFSHYKNEYLWYLFVFEFETEEKNYGDQLFYKYVKNINVLKDTEIFSNVTCKQLVDKITQKNADDELKLFTESK